MKNEKWMQPIEAFLLEYLLRVEMRYGDCRAPFLFPARFRLKRKLFHGRLFTCRLVVDDTPPRPVVLKAVSPEELLGKTREFINVHFGVM